MQMPAQRGSQGTCFAGSGPRGTGRGRSAQGHTIDSRPRRQPAEWPVGERLAFDPRGVTSVEYAIIAGILALAIPPAFTGFVQRLVQLLDTVSF